MSEPSTPSATSEPEPGSGLDSAAGPAAAGVPEAPPEPAPQAEVTDTLVPPDLPPPALPPVPPPERPPEAFVFHGRVQEYFGIWIVNTLLILVTFGLYFAWARVRKRRYLRGSTELLGQRFDYRADPRRLLIGTLMVAAVFLAYSVFGAVYPVVRVGAMLVAVVLLPWVVVRSLSFNAHNTVYRGMRFRFNSSLSGSAMVYLIEPLLLVLSLGFYYPAWIRSRKRYLIANHRLGDAYFRFEGVRVKPFYSAYLGGGAILLGLTMLAGMLIGITAAAQGNPSQAALLPFYALYGLGLFIGRHYVHAQLFNHVWNHTQLDGHRFIATMKTGTWLKLQLTNLGAILGTAGILYPWAVIRTHRYTASCLSLRLAGPVETISLLGSGAAGGAAGDTAAEFLGLDFGL